LVIVRPVAEDDADLLVGWHNDPDVARYWDGETFTREEMLLRFANSDVDGYLVLEGEEPVGYLQAWFADDLAEEGGLDMFLVPTARERFGVSPWIPTCPTRAPSAPGRRRASSRSRSANRITSIAHAGSSWRPIGTRSASHQRLPSDLAGSPA
jgi:hypothetical protein